MGNETTYIYDERGNVVQEVDPVGKLTKRTYDEADNLLSETIITSESGEEGYTTTFTYDEQGNQTSRTDPLGNTERYTYNQYNQLLTETDALGNTTTYDYDSRGNLLTITDATGNATHMGYDSRGNLLRLTDAAGQTTEFTYDSSGNVETVIDALKEPDEDSPLHTTRYEYDNNGNREKETRWVTSADGSIVPVITEWDYDDEGKLKSVTNPEGETTRYEYDGNGNQIAVINPLGRRTEYRYDDKDQLIETIYPDETPENLEDNPRTIHVFDRANRRRATIDEAGQVTYYNYDTLDRLTETIYPDGEDTVQDLVKTIDPNLTLETLDWTEVVYPDASPAYLEDNPTTVSEYYQDGPVKAQIDELGNRTEYRYDENRRRIETIYPELDSQPKVTYSSTTEYDAVGRAISRTDAEGRTTEFVYDELGRSIETSYPDETSTTTTYDELGRRIATTDQEGKVTEYKYDALGQLTAVVQYLDQDSDNPISVETEYGYDELGRLIRQEDANDHATLYEYDLAGRRTVVELSEGQRDLTVYNAVGKLESYTNFNGETITYEYDERNRLIEKDFVGEDTSISYTYTPTGLRETVTDSRRGTVTYEYDERNRLISRVDPEEFYIANGKTIEYSYDDVGNRTSVITPSGTVDYTFDEWNRLEAVTDGEDVTTYSYDGVSNLIRTEFPNEVVETREYDELNRLLYLENALDGSIISSYTYTLDKVGNRLSVKEQDGRLVEYDYDDLYRLVEEKITDAESVNDGRIISYTYDLVGNRLQRDDSVEGGTTYTYNDNDWLLTEVTVNDGETVSVAYRYDDNGNTIARIKDGTEETTYVWDYENRLVEVRLPDGSVIGYVYGDDGIRVSTTVNGVTTHYLVDQNRPYAQVLEEYVAGELEVRYAYGHDLISQEREGETAFYQVDGLGSTRVLTDETGGVVQTYTYDGFGELIESTGEEENSYQFAGEQYDEGLDQYYLRQRYYEPAIGRFTRRDTFEGIFGEPITLHKYLYANDNPILYTDPSGLYVSI